MCRLWPARCEDGPAGAAAGSVTAGADEVHGTREVREWGGGAAPSPGWATTMGRRCCWGHDGGPSLWWGGRESCAWWGSGGGWYVAGGKRGGACGEAGAGRRVRGGGCGE